ncbi:dipeptide/oligopeptide/nickel ABC transporter permease/ATP-binding protein [Okibacterium endophyticum]
MSVLTTTPDVAATAGPLTSAFRRALRRPLAVVAAVVVLVIVVACAAAPLIAPYDPLLNDLAHSLDGPSSAHLLGTDKLGRDVLSRLLYGGRPALISALLVSVVALAISIPLGVLAGYIGGNLDRIIMRVTDVAWALPTMVILLVILAVFGGSLVVANLALGLLLVPPVTQNLRGSARAVRGELYIDAARASGVSQPRIVFRHVLPRIAGPVLVQATIVASMAILFTSGLAYLGFGVQPPTPTWGSMVTEGATAANSNGWLLASAGGIIAVTVIAFGIIGDTVRDVVVETWAGAPRSRRRVRAFSDGVAGSGSATSLLEFRNVSITYGREHETTLVVKDVSLSLDAGEIVGIVGESGSGKTTLARAVLGLLRGSGEVSGGHILFEGNDVASLPTERLRALRGARLGYVSQEPMAALDPMMRVGTLIAETLTRLRGVSKHEARVMTLELLRTVQLTDPQRVARLYPHQVSGGMAQRIAIAWALAGDPSLLIADEPTTALDVTVQAEILDLLRALRDRRGMAILVVTHDFGVVSDICDRAIVMRDGQVVESGPLPDLLLDPQRTYTQSLVARARTLAGLEPLSPGET